VIDSELNTLQHCTQRLQHSLDYNNSKLCPTKQCSK